MGTSWYVLLSFTRLTKSGACVLLLQYALNIDFSIIPSIITKYMEAYRHYTAFAILIFPDDAGLNVYGE